MTATSKNTRKPKEIHPNVASILALTAEYSLTQNGLASKNKKQLLKLIEKDDPNGYGVDIFNALLGEDASPSAIKAAEGLHGWARSNTEEYFKRRKK